MWLWKIMDEEEDDESLWDEEEDEDFGDDDEDEF